MKLDRLVLAVASAVMLASAVPAASQPASSAISDLTPFSGPGHVIINDAGRAAWVPDVEYNTGVREEGPDASHASSERPPEPLATLRPLRRA